MDEVITITKNIKAGDIAPVYFLMGEEAYYIDKLSEFIENSILTEEEKSFNQMVLYGRDVSLSEILSHAKRFPLMADRQVIIVKEAQELSRSIDQLESYLENVQPTTVLVFCYKYKSIDKRKKVYKLLQKNAILYESKKLREYQIDPWLRRVLKGKGYEIEPKAAAMLVEFLGTDLAKIANELEKLSLVVPPKSLITAVVVEENIGISKDFNNFELVHAIVNRKEANAHKIVKHFALNPKNNPLVLTLGLVYAYFSKLLLYHGLKDKSATHAVKALKISQYALKDYEIGSKNYPMRKVSQIVSVLKDIDLKAKGVGAQNITQHDLLKEMLVRIFNG